MENSKIRSKEMNKEMRFGTWNVRTLLQAGNMNAIAEELQRYKRDVAALQEICWKGKGIIRKLKYTMYYSGNENRQGNRGVGFIVSKKASKSVLGFLPICIRIRTLRIKGKPNRPYINIQEVGYRQ
jgi:exonuclease III